MDWNLMDKEEAERALTKMIESGYRSFQQENDRLDEPDGPLNEDYRSLRRELLDAWDFANEEVRRKSAGKDRVKYLTDLLFAKELYLILQKRGMDIRFASYDKIWIYLDVKVVPDIVFERFNKSDYLKNKPFTLSKDHFYSKSARIYLKTLWWYIYLSMRFDSEGNEDLEKTVYLLKGPNMTTDTIQQMVERTGREGYRVDVHRNLIKYYGDHPKEGQDDFRKVTVLNTARTTVIEPSLSEGGDSEYVRKLFEYFKQA